jgi:hypothetical protein
MQDTTYHNFFKKNKFYRTAEGDIGRLAYQTEDRISLEMSSAEVEIHKLKEVALTKLTEKQKKEWYEEYVISKL